MKTKTMQTFDVWLDGRIIETIPCSRLSREELQRSLIEHDSYDPRIVLTLDTHPLSMAYHFQKSAEAAWKKTENETQTFIDELNARFRCPDCFSEYWTGWDIPRRKVICNGCGARVQL